MNIVRFQDVPEELRPYFTDKALVAKASCSKCHGRGVKGFYSADVVVHGKLRARKGTPLYCRCVRVNVDMLQSFKKQIEVAAAKQKEEQPPQEATPTP